MESAKVICSNAKKCRRAGCTHSTPHEPKTEFDGPNGGDYCTKLGWCHFATKQVRCIDARPVDARLQTADKPIQ